MCTVAAQQSGLAVTVAKKHQILAEYPYLDGRTVVCQLLGERRRLPEATEEYSSRGACIGLGQQVILFLGQHNVSLYTRLYGSHYRSSLTRVKRPQDAEYMWPVLVSDRRLIRYTVPREGGDDRPQMLSKGRCTWS